MMLKLFLLPLLAICPILLFQRCSRKNIPQRGSAIKDRTFSITGHRGAAGLAPENTIAAVEMGIFQQCDRIEIDVHQTADSMIVVMHDESIDRTTSGKGSIRNLVLSEIRKFPIKTKNWQDSTKLFIPTLEDVLKTVNGRCTLLIELKQGSDYYPGIEQRVIDLIRKYKAENWCMIHSFKNSILAEVHRVAPDIPLHRLLLNGLFGSDSLASYISEVSVFNRTLTKGFIDKMHKKGKKVNVWTSNNAEDMKYFINLGVDGVITDFPDIARQVKLQLSTEK